MNRAAQRIDRKVAGAVVEREAVERQVEAARRAVRDRRYAGELPGRLHRFEIRVEQQRLQVALVRARKLDARELQRERSQRLLVREIEARATAPLCNLRMIEGEA